MLISLLLVGFTSLAFYFYNLLWLKPERIREKLRRQGITGPPPSFFYGNIPAIKIIRSEMANTRSDGKHVSHDYLPHLFPHLEKWRKDYGPVFVNSMGNLVVIYVTDHNFAKEIIQCKSMNLGRASYLRKNRGALLGNSIVSAAGASWAHQRKIIAPEFFMDKVKGMVDMMVECAIPLVKPWEDKAEEGGTIDIRVDEDLRSFSADIISKACFGSNCRKGKDIFAKLRALMVVLSKQSLLLGVPGFRFVPMKSNREAWRLNKEITSTILEIVNHRKVNATQENDFLRVLMESNTDGRVGSNKTTSFIVDNCKAMYFAGQETISTSAAFTLVLLAHNPEWQTRVRTEVIEICGGQLPDVDKLRKMKTLTTVIQETLRLYPSSPFWIREAFEDMKIGDYEIPEGTTIWVEVGKLQRDREIWGPDASNFNPERFAHGISRASKVPHLYMSFGTGPRSCLGQNFAMVELKVVLSLIISKFSFSLSPNYHHSIAHRIVLEPEDGVYLLMKRV